jgi:hypothetical protein
MRAAYPSPPQLIRGSVGPEEGFRRAQDVQAFQRACEAIFSRFDCFDAVSASCSQFNASPSRTSRARGLSVCAAGLQAVHGPVPAQFDMGGLLFGRTGAFHRVVFADASWSQHGELTPEQEARRASSCVKLATDFAHFVMGSRLRVPVGPVTPL